MRIGLHALGIGTGARPDVIEAVATGAERVGFSTLWAGEHVVMVDRPRSRYPYADDGRISVPADADWLDPLALLPFAAAVTSRIRLATGVLLLAEHHPVALAKRAASVDVLSNGRLALGVGVGWSADEFTALGVPFEERGRRFREYVDVLRRLWREDVSSFDGDFVRYEAVRSYPKPARDRRIPIIIGGNGDRALQRVVTYGDGWYGFNLTRTEVGDRLSLLASLCDRNDRDPGSVEVVVALRDGDPDMRSELADLGITELVIVASPPADATQVRTWIDRLATTWGLESAPRRSMGPGSHA